MALTRDFKDTIIERARTDSKFRRAMLTRGITLLIAGGGDDVQTGKAGYDSEIIEKQLAHKASGALGEAYDRTQFLPQRTKMMQDWADYLDALAAGGTVIQGKFGGMANG